MKREKARKSRAALRAFLGGAQASCLHRACGRNAVALRTIATLLIWLLVCVALLGQAEQHISRAQALLEQRRFGEAEIEAQSAIKADPGQVAAWKLRGVALQLLKRFPEAEQHFTTALARFPEDPELWFCLARVQYLQSSLKTAEASARRSLGLDPRHADAHLQLGLILEARLEYAEALLHYQRTVELSRKQPKPHALAFLSLAQLLVKLERFDEALGVLTEAKKNDPTSLQVLLLRGRVLERLNRFDKAEEDYVEATRLDRGPEARGQLARLRGRATSGPDAVPGKGVPVRPVATDPVSFRNAASQSGLQFTLRNGATGNKYQVETMAGGVAVLDYDGDGQLDVFFTNGAELPSMRKTSALYSNRLFRNKGNASFEDVTERAGVGGAGYSIAAAVGDYDNNGAPDLFVAGVHRNTLYRNNKDGTFADVTDSSGFASQSPMSPPWSVSAAWLDYDNDGHLDLFVSNYCKWNPETDPYCGARLPGFRTYCYPDKYEGLPNQLFRNNGNGTFSDVSTATGIARHIGKGMGTAIADYDDNGFVDILVANDTLPNFLFRNSGRGTFEEVGLLSGIGLNDSRMPTSSMGTDFRDYDNDGREDVIITALAGETFPVFRNAGKGYFTDETFSTGLGLSTVKRSGWSMGVFDLDNDGLKDVFTSNSHVVDNIELYNEQVFREPNAVFSNRGDGRFADVSKLAGEDFQAKAAHRGCAFGDFNNDGKIDVVTTSLNEPSELWLNQSAGENHWLFLRLVGTASNRSGIGAKIKVTTPDGRVQFNHVTTSVGYASSSDVRVHFGLGSARLVRTVEIRWPGEAVQVEHDLPVDRTITIIQRRNPPGSKD